MKKLKFNNLISFFFRTNEAAKPTIALDYNYAKKPKNIDTVNHFYHIISLTLI